MSVELCSLRVSKCLTLIANDLSLCDGPVTIYNVIVGLWVYKLKLSILLPKQIK